MDTKQQMIAICICFITTGLLVSGCGPALTPTPTLTPLPTPTPLPEKTPPPVRIWEGVTVETICLETELTFPQAEGPILDPVGETVRNILTDMGLQIVNLGASCDATLTLITHVEAFRFDVYRPCYTDGRLHVKISLTAKGQEAFSSVIRAEKPPAETVLASYCEKHLRPEDFLEYYFFQDRGAEPLVDVLADLWGPQALVWTLDKIDTGHWPTLVSRKLEAIGPTDEVILALIYALQDESDDLRQYAASMVYDFAPEAEEAIPFLAQAAKDGPYMVRREAAVALTRFGPLAVDAVPVLIEVLDTDNGYIVYGALKAITGQDFGLKAERWRKWWEAKR